MAPFHYIFTDYNNIKRKLTTVKCIKFKSLFLISHNIKNKFITNIVNIIYYLAPFLNL